MRPSIKQLTTAALAVGIAALVLSACGGSSSGTATAAKPSAGIVSVHTVKGTKVLADSQGKTLYSANVERGGNIMCTGGCTSFWKPMSATAGQARTAAADLHVKLGVVKRSDGSQQLTYKGLPLYTFTQEGAGQLDGNGFADQFNGTHFQWMAATVGSKSASSSSGGSSYSSPY
jgi:predicted lipoprotein with Yx(FWY)xxD motif